MMRLLLLFLTLLTTGILLAQPIVESDVDEIRSDQFLLVVHPLQTTLYGPNLVRSKHGSELTELSGLWELNSAWMIPALVGMGIQISNFQGHQLSAKNAVESRATQFDYFGETIEALDNFSTEHRWVDEPIYDTEFSSSLDGGWRTDGVAEQLYRSTGARNMVFLDFVFFISPDLLQVRIIADMKVYKSPTRETVKAASYAKRLEYLGTPVDAACRQWKAGAREELIQEIETIYEEKMSAYPHNEKVYNKEHKLALKSIEDRTIMPPALVIANCWSDDSLHSALRLGISDVIKMLRAEFGTLVPNTPRAGETISFEGLNPKGKRKRFNGEIVHESGASTLVRLKSGDIYSVPTVPGSP